MVSLKSKTKAGLQLVKDTFGEWSEDDAPRFAAALSFYTMLSLAPLLLILISVIGWAIGGQSANQAVLGQAEGIIGRQGADALRMVAAGANRPGAGVISTIIGVVVLLLGATGVFGQLQAALNTMWEVKPKKMGIWGIIRQRLLSMSALGGIAFLLLVSLLVSTGLAALGSSISGLFPGAGIIIQIVTS